jgi:hypothetical protein
MNINSPSHKCVLVVIGGSSMSQDWPGRSWKVVCPAEALMLLSLRVTVTKMSCLVLSFLDSKVITRETQSGGDRYTTEAGVPSFYTALS